MRFLYFELKSNCNILLAGPLSILLLGIGLVKQHHMVSIIIIIIIIIINFIRNRVFALIKSYHLQKPITPHWNAKVIITISGWVDNVRKGENTGYQHFLFFQQ